MYTTLITPEQLMALQASGAPLMVFDCSFDLANPAAGEEQYRNAHIPGAVYAHLDTALSDKGTPDRKGKYQPHPDAASGGRHPLPNREKFAVWLSKVGFANEMQAVVYDRNAATYCGRLWWMLKWAGHEAVAVLDGGLQAWQAAGGEVTGRTETSHFQSNFELRPPLRKLATTQDVLQHLGGRQQTIVDARATPRFKGEVEPLDPVAGHIPGALNRPFSCAPSSSSCWPAAIPPGSCITAAAASARCRTSSRWKLRVSRPPRCMRAAGASGAATRSGRSKRASARRPRCRMPCWDCRHRPAAHRGPRPWRRWWRCRSGNCR